jgi:hypothetical protein
MQTSPIETTTALDQLTLSDLAKKSFDELGELYARGRVPGSLRAVDGPLVGRMLAIKGLAKGPIAKQLRRFAGSRAFVWGGKSFTSENDKRGTGINRVNLPGVLGRQNLFPFETRFDTSAVDGKQSIVLDYDLSQNPPYIRRIHDEIREVSPGLYLGPAMWKAKHGPVTVLWFALDTGKQR